MGSDDFTTKPRALRLRGVALKYVRRRRSRTTLFQFSNFSFFMDFGWIPAAVLEFHLIFQVFIRIRFDQNIECGSLHSCCLFDECSQDYEVSIYSWEV